MRLKRALDKAGVGGLFLVAACYLRIKAVFWLLAAMGLGFLTRNAFLMPAMGILLAIILAGLVLDFGVHRRVVPLAIAVPGALALYFFVFIHRVNLAVYVALSGLILGRILNHIFVRQPIRVRPGDHAGDKAAPALGEGYESSGH
ncbi:MAG: hypothetical protein EPN47_04445 [Acidobacteria bacterium]|nr:MAG: hypothetical protein EPN47_04445 [Acidobacteriota bacterium]